MNDGQIFILHFVVLCQFGSATSGLPSTIQPAALKRGKIHYMASLLSIFPLGTLLQSESGDEVRASCRILEKCSESAFQSLVTAATDAVRSSTSAVALAGHPALSSFPSTTALECSRALLALVVDFARCNVSGASVTGAIEECGLSPSKAASFSSIYSSVLSGLRESLGSAGTLSILGVSLMPSHFSLTPFVTQISQGKHRNLWT